MKLRTSLQTALTVTAVYCGAGLTVQAHADVMLTPTYDVHAVNRTTSAGPIVSDGTNVNVVNFAWDVETYLQFDLSDVEGIENATGMTLRLYERDNGQSPDLKSDIIDLYATGDNWSPDSTYNEMPGYESGLLDRLDQPAQGGVNVIGWAEWSIDPADIADDIGDGAISFILDNTQQTGAWNMTTYHSSEYDLGQFAPQLVIEGQVSLVPEPTSLIALIIASLPLMRRRNRP